MTSLDELVAAVGDPTVAEIVVSGHIKDVPALKLASRQRLTGADAVLTFTADGLELAEHNEIRGLTLEAPPTHRAVHTASDDVSLGELRLVDLTVTGQVRLVAASGTVTVEGIDITAADTRSGPRVAGVVPEGAFTLRNTGSGEMFARLLDISAGRDGAPVRGGGVLVGGAGWDSPGQLVTSRLRTGPVYVDGGLAAGTDKGVNAGVFVSFGVHASEVVVAGPVTTYGVNDMVCDNWGAVDSWTVRAPLTSYGPSGIGFVNFGTIKALRVLDAIETHGEGARGFNVYPLNGSTGSTIGTAEFESITTHGNAAIGIHIDQPIGQLLVHNNIITHGGAGKSLILGELVELNAHALSILPGGAVDHIDIGGTLQSTTPGVPPLDIQGTVGRLVVAGGIGH